MGRNVIKGAVFLNYLVDRELEPVAEGSGGLVKVKEDTKSKFKVKIKGTCRDTGACIELRLGISGYTSIFKDAIEYFINSAGLPDSVCKPMYRNEWSIRRIPEEVEGYRRVRKLIEKRWNGFKKGRRGSPYSYPIR